MKYLSLLFLGFAGLGIQAQIVEQWLAEVPEGSTIRSEHCIADESTIYCSYAIHDSVRVVSLDRETGDVIQAIKIASPAPSLFTDQDVRTGFVDDDDNLTLIGGNQSKMWIVKLDPEFDTIWTRGFEDYFFHESPVTVSSEEVFLGGADTSGLVLLRVDGDNNLTESIVDPVPNAFELYAMESVDGEIILGYARTDNGELYKSIIQRVDPNGSEQWISSRDFIRGSGDWSDYRITMNSESVCATGHFTCWDCSIVETIISQVGHCVGLDDGSDLIVFEEPSSPGSFRTETVQFIEDRLITTSLETGSDSLSVLTADLFDGTVSVRRQPLNGIGLLAIRAEQEYWGIERGSSNLLSTYNNDLSTTLDLDIGELGAVGQLWSIGSDTVLLSTTRSGQSVTALYTISSSTSLDLVADLRLAVYPNPASNHLIIEGLERPSGYRVFDLAGSLQKSGTTAGAVPLDGISSGFYWIQINEQALQFSVVR